MRTKTFIIVILVALFGSYLYIKLILGAIDGRFGKKVLKDQYRNWWRLFTYGTIIMLFIRFVMFPFFEWWQGVVDFLNYVIWG